MLPEIHERYEWREHGIVLTAVHWADDTVSVRAAITSVIEENGGAGSALNGLIGAATAVRTLLRRRAAELVQVTDNGPRISAATADQTMRCMRLAGTCEEAIDRWSEQRELRAPKVAQHVVIESDGTVHLIETDTTDKPLVRNGGRIYGYAEGPAAPTRFHPLRENASAGTGWEIAPDAAIARPPARIEHPEIVAAHQRAWYEHVWMWYADALRAGRIRIGDDAAVHSNGPLDAQQ